MEPWYRRNLWALALASVALLACGIVAMAVLRYRLPFSWDVWYHIGMGEAFKGGFVWWDWGSFGPTGRPNLYPPAFHLFLAALSLVLRTPVQSVARALPLVFYPVTIALVYWLAALLYGRRTALLAALLCSFVPVFVDRGVIASSQALAVICMLLCLVFFLKAEGDRRYAVASGVCGALVVLGHGLTLIVLAACLLVAAAVIAWEYRARGDSPRPVLVNVGIVVALCAAIPSYWLYYLFGHGVYSTIPQTTSLALKFYPDRLGALQIGLALAGVAVAATRRSRADRILMGWLAATFLLSSSMFWVLPTRFIEFVAIPLAILAAVALERFFSREHPYAAFGLVGVVLVAMAGPYVYVNAIGPLVYEQEEAAFLWLRTDAAAGGQLMTGWFFAPVGGTISGKVPIKGAYYSGSFRYLERTGDTDALYAGDLTILGKYDIAFVYYGRKEADDYGPLSFLDESDAVSVPYSCGVSTFYHILEE